MCRRVLPEEERSCCRTWPTSSGMRRCRVSDIPLALPADGPDPRRQPISGSARERVPTRRRALSAAPLSSHPPQPDRRRERDVLTTDGFPAHTMSDAAGSTMAQAVVVLPTPRAAPMSGSNELSRPKRSPLHTFRNGCLAHRKCCCDRVQKVADEQLQLRALGGHASGLRP